MQLCNMQVTTDDTTIITIHYYCVFKNILEGTNKLNNSPLPTARRSRQ